MGTLDSRLAGLRFARAVWRLVKRIPRGRVVTYGQVAVVLGRPRGARAVGRAMRECPTSLPWHRVVNAQGGISPRARMSGMLTQRLRLEAEGIPFRRGRVRLSRYRWRFAQEAAHEPRAPSQLLRPRARSRLRQDPGSRAPGL
ncbi:MAG TPA: MGMT family protein [Methylomirabilota bacterium]